LQPSSAKKLESPDSKVQHTVFDLPQNPIELKSFKYTFVKSRVTQARLTQRQQVVPNIRIAQQPFSRVRSAKVRSQQMIKKHMMPSREPKKVGRELGYDLPNLPKPLQQKC
jgi:hypothetical protein